MNDRTTRLGIGAAAAMTRRTAVRTAQRWMGFAIVLLGAGLACSGAARHFTG